MCSGSVDDHLQLLKFVLVSVQIPGSGQCPGMRCRLGFYPRNAS